MSSQIDQKVTFPTSTSMILLIKLQTGYASVRSGAHKSSTMSGTDSYLTKLMKSFTVPKELYCVISKNGM